MSEDMSQWRAVFKGASARQCASFGLGRSVNMAVAEWIVFALSVLGSQYVGHVNEQADMSTLEQMWQREEQLRQEMARLLDKMKHKVVVEEATLSTVFQQWHIWAVVGAFLVLCGLCWLARRRKTKSARSRKEISSSSEGEGEENKGKVRSGARRAFRSSAKRTFGPLQELTNLCKELVGDLLCISQALCRNIFMPQLQLATGTHSTYNGWSLQEDGLFYRVHVFLDPPPGFSFLLNLDPTGQWPARQSDVRLELNCVCSRERLLGDVKCILHHLNDNVGKYLALRLLRTLCTKFYLDTEKVASWVQVLVKKAWVLLPMSHHCQLTVLPSSHSCKLQVTNASQRSIFIEMIIAMQQAE
ncbi:inositol 1,4,5-trisphosphate receptor-interacting protein-like 1 [Cygnus olor]|uniref:inositol 1,4,5-trisphosphate receptor-interacting protein-like 1 n=1 Tax=Cygnus olor TaxID=8869 RepID=UPI001ADE02FE|nr:inositol 1,4,5-trisphosphate receptor-interacting protein-like 1 [Cygnus olor]